MDEIEALRRVDEALSATDRDARGRILHWINSKYGPGVLPAAPSLPTATTPVTNPPPVSADKREIEGIAELDDEGNLQITVRDLKAKNKKSAALRLVHIIIHAHEALLGEPPSSRNVVTPWLKQYRLYDGNIRAEISSHKGILRQGEVLKLDAHAKREAEEFIREALDPSVVGKWDPNLKPRKRASKASK